MTPYSDINALLERLLADVKHILGEQFRGMYLYGSLALGDFAPHRSDIDLLVATNDILDSDAIHSLKQMHERIVTEYPRWGPEVECSYIHPEALRKYVPGDAAFPHIQRGGKLEVEQQDAAMVIQNHILRNHGITLAGPPPEAIIDAISPDELRRATADIVREWWRPMPDDPSRLYHSGYQAYAVLTMCRVLYTLEYGTIVSKPTAARWARQGVAKQWSNLIDWALEWGGVAERVEVEEVVGLIRYTVGRCSEWELGNNS